MAKQPNWRRVKLHRNYSYDELAMRLGICKGTVRNWVRNHGLHAVTDKRPHLIIAKDAADFLQARHAKRRVRTKSDEMFCFGCKAPRIPAGRLVDCFISSATTVRLQGICPECETLMNKRASPTGIDQLHRLFEVSFIRA